MNLAHLAEMQVGRRVRAALDIVYAEYGDEIAEGHEGRLEAVGCGGALADVLWDGQDEPRTTLYDSLVVLPEGTAP